MLDVILQGAGEFLARSVGQFQHNEGLRLDQALGVEPADGPVWLHITGPEGTTDFLSSLEQGELAAPSTT